MASITTSKATAQDEARAVDLLVRAFENDPPLNWLLRQDRKREAAFREFFSVAYRKMTLPFGCVEFTDDGTGVALWTPPGRWKLDFLTETMLLPNFIRVMGLGTFVRKLSGVNRLQHHHPQAPHYYLFAMGVEPALQGRGIGSALLRTTLDRCDQERTPAYLEASTEASRRLYERLGFVTQEVLRMAPEAPPLWAMWREPR